jgi:hypothetical protein
MMSNNDNRDVKIQHHRYNNSSRRGKRKLHKGRVAGAVVSLALIVGLGIGGYRLAGKLSEINKDSVNVSTNIPEDSVVTVESDASENTIETIEPSVDTIVTSATEVTTTVTTIETTEATTVTNTTDKDGNIIGADGEVSIWNDNSSGDTASDDDTTFNQVPNDTPSKSNDSSSVLDAYYLTEDDISNANSLESALENVDGCQIVVLPLKAQGGMLNYNSQIKSARNCGVVTSSFDLSDMVEIVKSKGLTPYAQMSVLYDNIYPKTFKQCAYQFEDGTGSWWDDYGEKGGKPWLSPFADDTKNYLSALASEFTEDGIEGIICTDVIFPNFREKDLGYIGDIVKSESRYTALLDVLNVIENSANGKTVYFEFSLVDALSGNVEALKADELNKNIVLVPKVVLSDLSSTFSYGGNSISLESQSSYDKVKLSMELFEKMSGDLKVVPSVELGSLTASQRESVTSALSDLGYKYYFHE